MAGDAMVIVGAGLAGAKAAETLRAEGFGGEVVMVGEEAERPYERPPLSKGYLLGDAEKSSIYVHQADWYRENQVDLRLGAVVTGIDRARHLVSLADGGAVRYGKLLLTTGASPPRLTVPGSELDGVLYLRRVADSERLAAALRSGGQVVIVGAGWVGMEVAAAARLAGREVTVVSREPVPLHGALGPEMGAMFTELHAERGVEFRFGESVSQLRGSRGRVAEVVTGAGERLPADVVVVGIGAAPNVGLAEGADLEVRGGVVVDAALRTSDPDVFAAGDVARAYSPLYGKHIRVDHWANALGGGPAAARSMLGGTAAYDPVPYFFSDQYDLGLETAGLPSPGSYDQVLCRGDRAKREFIAFWLSGGVVVAGMNVNVWDVTDDIQALIRARGRPDPSRLADPAVPLSDL